MRKSKSFGNLRQVQLVHIEAILVAVGCISVHVGSVRIPRAPVQVVVLFDHSPELQPKKKKGAQQNLLPKLLHGSITPAPSVQGTRYLILWSDIRTIWHHPVATT